MRSRSRGRCFIEGGGRTPHVSAQRPESRERVAPALPRSAAGLHGEKGRGLRSRRAGPSFDAGPGRPRSGRCEDRAGTLGRPAFWPLPSPARSGTGSTGPVGLGSDWSDWSDWSGRSGGRVRGISPRGPRHGALPGLVRCLRCPVGEGSARGPVRLLYGAPKKRGREEPCIVRERSSPDEPGPRLVGIPPFIYTIYTHNIRFKKAGAPPIRVRAGASRGWRSRMGRRGRGGRARQGEAGQASGGGAGGRRSGGSIRGGGVKPGQARPAGAGQASRRRPGQAGAERAERSRAERERPERPRSVHVPTRSNVARAPRTGRTRRRSSARPARRRS